MKALADCRLYTFVDTAYLRGRNPTAVTQALCEGGADIIQLRAKGVPKAEVLRMASEILPIANASGVWLVINDFPDIAAGLGAPGCHLGQEDFFDAGHSEMAGLKRGIDLRIGLSTHAPAQAERAVAAGADYIAVGPVYATATKPTATAVTLEYVRWASTHIKIPWFAIGGITLDNIGEVVACGATRICVVAAILRASNIAVACEKFKERLASTTNH